MDVKTVFGWTTHIPTIGEFIHFIIAFIILIVIIIILLYFRKIQEKKIHARQLFMFRMRNRGLSSFQIKMLTNLAESLDLKDANLLLEKPAFYEKAFTKFLAFLKGKNEADDSLLSICRESIAAYEKLYHAATGIREPISSGSGIEAGTLIYFITEYRNSYIAKITDVDDSVLKIRFFHGLNYSKNLPPEIPITVYLWRSGDAEYSFQSMILGTDNSILTIRKPGEMSRIREIRQAYTSVLIPFTLTAIDPATGENVVEREGAIFRLTEDEAVINVLGDLIFQKTYRILADVMNTPVTLDIQVIADSLTSNRKNPYYTVKFVNMDEGRRHLLKKVIAAQRKYER